eukprot:g19479.t1
MRPAFRRVTVTGAVASCCQAYPSFDCGAATFAGGPPGRAPEESTPNDPLPAAPSEVAVDDAYCAAHVPATFRERFFTSPGVGRRVGRQTPEGQPPESDEDEKERRERSEEEGRAGRPFIFLAGLGTSGTRFVAQVTAELFRGVIIHASSIFDGRRWAPQSRRNQTLHTEQPKRGASSSSNPGAAAPPDSSTSTAPEIYKDYLRDYLVLADDDSATIPPNTKQIDLRTYVVHNRNLFLGGKFTSRRSSPASFALAPVTSAKPVLDRFAEFVRRRLDLAEVEVGGAPADDGYKSAVNELVADRVASGIVPALDGKASSFFPLLGRGGGGNSEDEVERSLWKAFYYSDISDQENEDMDAKTSKTLFPSDRDSDSTSEMELPLVDGVSDFPYADFFVPMYEAYSQDQKGKPQLDPVVILTEREPEAWLRSRLRNHPKKAVMPVEATVAKMLVQNKLNTPVLDHFGELRSNSSADVSAMTRQQEQVARNLRLHSDLVKCVLAKNDFGDPSRLLVLNVFSESNAVLCAKIYCFLRSKFPTRNLRTPPQLGQLCRDQ